MAEKPVKVKFSFEPQTVVYEMDLPGNTSVDEGIKKAYEALAKIPGKTELATRLDTILKSEDGYTLRRVVKEREEVTTETVEPDEKFSDIAENGMVEISPIAGHEPAYFI